MYNKYGLDYTYFEQWVERILNNGGFKNYRPHQCAREFARMSRAADEAVLLEPEFTSALHERLRIAESERDALRAELEALKQKTSSMMGVGNGSGNLFVYGDCESIKAAQNLLLQAEKDKAKLETKNERRRRLIIWLRYQIEAAGKQEPIYQYSNTISGLWTDCDAETYSIMRDEYKRIVYASPAPAQQPKLPDEALYPVAVFDSDGHVVNVYHDLFITGEQINEIIQGQGNDQ